MRLYVPPSWVNRHGSTTPQVVTDRLSQITTGGHATVGRRLVFYGARGVRVIVRFNGCCGFGVERVSKAHFIQMALSEDPTRFLKHFFSPTCQPAGLTEVSHLPLRWSKYESYPWDFQEAVDVILAAIDWGVLPEGATWGDAFLSWRG